MDHGVLTGPGLTIRRYPQPGPKHPSRLPSTVLADAARASAYVSAGNDQGERVGVSQSSAAYESAARTKLRLGLTRLARAGNDGEILGLALSWLHGAVEN